MSEATGAKMSATDTVLHYRIDAGDEPLYGASFCYWIVLIVGSQSHNGDPRIYRRGRHFLPEVSSKRSFGSLFNPRLSKLLMMSARRTALRSRAK